MNCSPKSGDRADDSLYMGIAVDELDAILAKKSEAKAEQVHWMKRGSHRRQQHRGDACLPTPSMGTIRGLLGACIVCEAFKNVWRQSKHG